MVQVKEAEEHAEQDKRLKDVAHARNDAESLIHSTEKSVQEHKMKIPAEVRASLIHPAYIRKETCVLIPSPTCFLLS